MLGRLLLLLLSATAACGLVDPGDRTSPQGPTETPADPPTYSAEVPGLGELTVKFLEFHPPRGAQLVPGQGAWFTVEYSLPRADLVVDFETYGATTADGGGLFGTSFLAGGDPGPSFEIDFVCGDDSGSTYVSAFDIGRRSSRSTTFPAETDPDVPFVRVSVYVTPFESACSPPDAFSLDAQGPYMEIVERLDWKGP